MKNKDEAQFESITISKRLKQTLEILVVLETAVDLMLQLFSLVHLVNKEKQLKTECLITILTL